MKKVFSIALAGALFAAPAFAGSTTVEFTDSEGGKQVWTFNDDLTATGPEGVTATYTWDEATNTMCAVVTPTTEGAEKQEVCLTYASLTGESGVGDTSTYTTSDGGSGTAVITAKS